MILSMALVSDFAHKIRLYSNLFIVVYTTNTIGFSEQYEWKNGRSFGKKTRYE